jgi:integrase
MPRKRKSRAEKGRGCLHLRGNLYYLIFTYKGKRHTYPTGKADLEEAKTERDRFIERIKSQDIATFTGETSDGRKYPQDVVTVSELLDDYIHWLKKERKAKSADGTEDQINATIRKAPMFEGSRLAARITTQDMRDYRAMREVLGRADATVNKELGQLRSAFIHGWKRQSPKKVLEVPYFPMVKLNNARQGFVEIERYDSIMAEMPDSLKPFFMLAYHSGCRSGELKGVEWSQVNFRLRVVQLEPGKTKNDDGRNLPFYGDMEEVLRRQKALRDELFPTCPYVLFWHETDRMLGVNCVPGSRMNSCRKLWKAAMQRAGCKGITPHDLRRSAVRNMVQECGIPEEQAMVITGHKTHSMLKRYNIVSLKGVQQSGEKMDEWMRKMRAEAKRNPPKESVVVEMPSPPTMKQRVRALLAEGKNIQEVAVVLDIAESTVQYHRSDKAQAKRLELNRKYKRGA